MAEDHQESGKETPATRWAEDLWRIYQELAGQWDSGGLKYQIHSRTQALSYVLSHAAEVNVAPGSVEKFIARVLEEKPAVPLGDPTWIVQNWLEDELFFFGKLPENREKKKILCEVIRAFNKFKKKQMGKKN